MTDNLFLDLVTWDEAKVLFPGLMVPTCNPADYTIGINDVGVLVIVFNADNMWCWDGSEWNHYTPGK